METILLGVAVLLLLLVFSIPIGVSIGLGVLAALFAAGQPPALFIQKWYNSFDSFPMMAIPFFLLAGEIMARGTLSQTLLNWCNSLLGHRRGGLANISVVTSLFYGALSGSAIATTAAVGGIMIPEMEREGYPVDFACAVTATAGSLAVLIPPSIPLIVYGSFGGLPVSDLFLAGIIPGVFMALAIMLTSYVIIRRNNYGRLYKKASWATRWKTFKAAAPALGVPVIILGGIYGGIFTPTEAGVVAVVYALFVECFISRSMSGPLFIHICKSTLNSLGLIFFVVIPASALGTLLQYYNFQDIISQFLLGISDNHYVFLFVMTLVYLVLGCFLEVVVAVMILAPLLVPLSVSYGFDPVHFAIFTIVALCIGLVTPPVGGDLFVACSIGKVEILKLSKRCVPFIITLIVATLIIGLVPQLSTILVR